MLLQYLKTASVHFGRFSDDGGFEVAPNLLRRIGHGGCEWGSAECGSVLQPSGGVN